MSQNSLMLSLSLQLPHIIEIETPRKELGLKNLLIVMDNLVKAVLEHNAKSSWSRITYHDIAKKLFSRVDKSKDGDCKIKFTPEDLHCFIFQFYFLDVFTKISKDILCYPIYIKIKKRILRKKEVLLLGLVDLDVCLNRN